MQKVNSVSSTVTLYSYIVHAHKCVEIAKNDAATAAAAAAATATTATTAAASTVAAAAAATTAAANTVAAANTAAAAAAAVAAVATTDYKGLFFVSKFIVFQMVILTHGYYD